MRYTTYVTFEDGSGTDEETSQEALGSTIKRLTLGPAARLGIIKEIKIVDIYDCIVFHAEQKEGKNLPEIVFPTPQEIEDAKQ